MLDSTYMTGKGPDLHPPQFPSLSVYGLAPTSGACHWYRIREPLRGLAGIGATTEFGELFEEAIVRRHNTVLCHLPHGDDLTQAWEYLWEARYHRLVLDIDDDVWVWPDGSDQQKYWTAERKAQLEKCIRLAHLVTTPSRIIAEKIKYQLQLNDHVAILPNYLPAWTLQLPRTKPEQFTVGYQGAPQGVHQADLDMISEELFWFLEKCPDARLLFFGQPRQLPGAGSFASRVNFIPWETHLPNYYRNLASNMTVGIGPLRKSPYTAAKSGVRAAELACLGIPSVVSDLEPYRGWVSHRVTGYQIGYADIQGWRKTLIKLYRSPDLVDRISRQARAAAFQFTTENNAWEWDRAYRSVGPVVEAASPAV